MDNKLDRIISIIRKLNEEATPVEMAREEGEERMAHVLIILCGMDLEDLTKLNNALKGMTDV